MTENTATAPVRVPNVSPGARSGLDHTVIGANATEAHEANEALAASRVPVPEDLTTVDALLAWVEEAEDDETFVARAESVLAAERERPEDDQRTTLIKPLEGALAAGEPSDEDPAQPDPSAAPDGAPTSGIDTESAGQEAQSQGDPA